jgi:hypothetical protein
MFNIRDSVTRIESELDPQAKIDLDNFKLSYRGFYIFQLGFWDNMFF